MKLGLQNGLTVAFFALITFSNGMGCAITASRPVQEMSNTTAAIKAAKNVQAEVIEPELFQLAREWYFKAKKNYRLKNFALAKEQAVKSRAFAEEAEFKSVIQGGNRDLIQSGISESDVEPQADEIIEDEYESKEQFFEAADEEERRRQQLELEKARGSQLRLAPGETGESEGGAQP